MLSRNVKIARIYTKWSSLDDPWWGVYKNQLNLLELEDEDYYVRLDYPHGSILLTSDEIKDLVSTMNIAQDGSYKMTLSNVGCFA